jgi:cytochrome d ubiquinol oxidase subunit II
MVHWAFSNRNRSGILSSPASQFSLNEVNQVQWATPWHGLEALLNARNLALGLAVLFLARTNGLLYIMNTVDDDDLYDRSGRKLVMNSLSFLVFFLFFLTVLLVSEGFAYDRSTGAVTMEKFKYLHNCCKCRLSWCFLLREWSAFFTV